jgi:hypothetical protein
MGTLFALSNPGANGSWLKIYQVLQRMMGALMISMRMVSVFLKRLSDFV